MKNLLFTGPQGSGKTTRINTLLSVLDKAKIIELSVKDFQNSKPEDVWDFEFIVFREVTSKTDLEYLSAFTHWTTFIVETQIPVKDLKEIDLSDFHIIELKSNKDEQLLPCNCLEIIKKNVIDYAEKQRNNPKGYKVIDGHFENQSIFPVKRIYTNFIIKSTFTKKDETTSKPRNEHMNLFFNYCPFCGKKISDTQNKLLEKN